MEEGTNEFLNWLSLCFTRMHCIPKKQHLPGCSLSHWNISLIWCCIVFNYEGFLAPQSQKILPRQTWLWLAWSARGKARGEHLREPVTSLIPGRTRDFDAASQRHREHKKNIFGFHIISLILIDRDKVENPILSWYCDFFLLFNCKSFYQSKTLSASSVSSTMIKFPVYLSAFSSFWLHF